MKKIFFILLCIVLIGCSKKVISAKEALEKEIKYNYPNSVILCEKNEKEYYLGLLKENNKVILVILKKTGDGYNYFGSLSYDCSSKQDYGKYFYKDSEYSMVVIFSENKENYSKFLLEYINTENKNEKLSIYYTNNDTYILKLFLLPSEYDFININIE